MNLFIRFLLINTSIYFMQTKIFVHSSAEAAEKALNDWLETNNFQVQYIGQSQSEKGGKFVFIISVFYIRNELFQKLQKV